MDGNVIQFYPWGPGVKEIAPPPDLSKNNLPDYWKDMPRFHGESDYEKFKDGTADRKNVFLSMKHCMPYYDALTMGYHYLLHTDLFVSLENGVPKLSWDSTMDPVGDRSLKEMPTPHGHYNAHFGWQMYWGIQMPEGWSGLITHPINRYDLPFTTVSGLADYDVYPLPGNVSFHIKDNFAGVIKAGTPIFSIIPIKRENWSFVINEDTDFFKEKIDLISEKESVPMGHYKKKYRLGMKFH